MKYIDKKLNEEIETNIRLTPICKDGIIKYPYCKMKKTPCFETYRYECSNYREIEDVKN